MTTALVAAALTAGAAAMAGLAAGGADRRRLLGRASEEHPVEIHDASPSVPRGPAPQSVRGPARRPTWPPAIHRLLEARLPAMVTCAVTGLAVGIAVAGWIGSLAGAVAGAALPRWIRGRREARRVTQLEQQLGDAMDGIAAALRAGMSPSQAIAFAAAEGEPPLADALRAVGEREALGVPLDESLETWERSEPGDDVRLAVSVLELQHRVGGNAPAVLEEAVRTLRQRAAAARDLRSLTAQARLSGAILGLLPVGFFVFMSVVSRKEVSIALHTTLGVAAAVGGLLLDGLAFLWIRHLLREAG